MTMMMMTDSKFPTIARNPVFATPAAAVTLTTTTATTATNDVPAPTLATLELEYFKAVSLYRRRNYEKCAEVCNALLQTGHENNVQIFATRPDDENADHVDAYYNTNTNTNNNTRNSSTNNIMARNIGERRLGQQQRRWQQDGSNSKNNSSHSNGSKVIVIMPTWMMEGVWQLKMRALTQRVYVDDLETQDVVHAENEEIEFERIATAARPGTSIKTAFVPRPSTSLMRNTTGVARAVRTTNGTRSSDGRLLPSTMGTITRPTTGLARPGSSIGNRPVSRCATASRVRASSAAAFTVGDTTAPLYQASRLNPTIYAERQILVKALFQFLYYHEADVQKAYSLCEAVMEVHRQQRRHHSNSKHNFSTVDTESLWWWHQQMGRCLLTLHYPRKAETYLQQSLAAFPNHPDTYLLLARTYQRLDQPQRALQVINDAVDRHPFDVIYRTEQGRIYDMMTQPDDAMQIYRLIVKLNPINTEALACIALQYFYDNNPEMALMYYRRILSLGVHTPELYCNIALCCLYGGQIDLVLPCFQRALSTAKTSDQKAVIWYNQSFVAITTGDFNLARRCLQLCLIADARYGAALNNLAVLSAHTGDIMKAKSYLTAAKEVLIDSEEVIGNLKYMEETYKL